MNNPQNPSNVKQTRGGSRGGSRGGGGGGSRGGGGSPPSGGWLNNTVVIGNSNVLWATIGLAVIGISLFFGTAWISGIVSQIGLSVLFSGIAFYIAYQNRNMRPLDLTTSVIMFFIISRVALWVLVSYIPRTIIGTQDDLAEWNAVVDQVKEQAPKASDGDASPPLGVSELLGVGVPAYSFAGDATPEVAATPDQTATAIAVTPGATVGAVFVTPGATAAPASTPTPPPTADPVVALLYDMNTAEEHRDRAAGRTAAQAILRLEPGNEDAKNLIAKINFAENTLINKEAMPSSATWTKGDGEDGRVARALSGGTYIIIETHNVPEQWALACEMISTIEEVGGWLNGEQYMVKWCLLDQFNVDSVGDVFSADGG